MRTAVSRSYDSLARGGLHHARPSGSVANRTEYDLSFTQGSRAKLGRLKRCQSFGAAALSVFFETALLHVQQAKNAESKHTIIKRGQIP